MAGEPGLVEISLARQAARVRWVAAAAALACGVATLLAAQSDQLMVVVLALAGLVASAWIASRPSVTPSEMGQTQAAKPPPPPAPDYDQIGQVLEGLSDAALVVNGAGRIMASNAAARRRFEFGLSGPRLSAVLRHPGLLDAVQAALDGAPARAVDYEATAQVEEFFRVTVAPVALPGERAAMMAFHDETRAINTEKMRVDFLANASHELRTPLASLTLLIETLSGHARQDEAARERFLVLMQAQAQRMRRLIDDLLSLSKIELDEHVPPADEADLAQIAREAIDNLGPIAREREVSLALQAPAAPMRVIGDRFQLAQVAQNLIDNAIKYSPPGGVVEVELALADSREEAAQLAGRHWPEAARISLLSPPPQPLRRYAVLRVADAGPGIALRHLPRLSERFYRVERDEKSDRVGTGLGLAIVKHIINRHRGGLTVESVVGRGSAFAIYVERPAEAARIKVAGPAVRHDSVINPP